jgi:hypothetical protein
LKLGSESQRQQLAAALAGAASARGPVVAEEDQLLLDAEAGAVSSTAK